MAGAGGNLIAVVAAIIGIGVIAQILSDRFQVPSVVFLITAGIILGPEVLGVVGPDSFGSALSAIVGLSVAIIVFEGAFHLRIQKLREAPTATLKLVTIGAGIALIGTAITVRFLLSTSWNVAFLVGALLVATGPTVVTPILEVVPVRDRVEAALETEGIVNDVTAAILAIVIFEAITAGVTQPGALLQLFTERLGIGLLIGAIVATLLVYGLQYIDLSPGNAPQNARLLVLAGALVAYGAADFIATEAGIAAVATAGIILGNIDIPYEEEISAFKGDITLIVLSFVFIALAALLEFEILRMIGLPGLGITAIVALVLRPLLVFISTRGDRFTSGEQLFMSFVGPRGIIPASVATLFAIELRNAGMLENRGENVVLIEQSQEVVEVGRNEGLAVHHGDGTDTDVLASAGGDNARIVVGATGDDDVNLLVSQLARSKFDPETILARVNNPDNAEAFEDLGVRNISTSIATAQALDNYIERPAMMDWMGEIGYSGDIQEIEVTSEDLIGRPIRDIGPELPPDSLIALIKRDGNIRVPEADLTLEHGDQVTVIGGRDEVKDAIKFIHPDK